MVFIFIGSSSLVWSKSIIPFCRVRCNPFCSTKKKTGRTKETKKILAFSNRMCYNTLATEA